MHIDYTILTSTVYAVEELWARAMATWNTQYVHASSAGPMPTKTTAGSVGWSPLTGCHRIRVQRKTSWV